MGSRWTWRSWRLVLPASTTLACAPAAETAGDGPGTTAGAVAATGGTSRGAETNTDVPGDHRTCIAPEDGAGTPRSIAEAVALLNALPRPVTIACLLESLDRPLHVELTDSVFSAQPAAGPEDPRIFIFSGPLVMSVVARGDGSRLLEFGEFVAPETTLKGELEFPVERELIPSDPYARVVYDEQISVCGFCHRNETRAFGFGDIPAYTSVALRPVEDSLVELSMMRAAAEACDDSSERCSILHALFDHGEVRHRPFPQELPTIFDE